MKKQFDLLARYKEKTRFHLSKKAKRNIFIAGIILCASVIGLSYLYRKNVELEKVIAENNIYLTDVERLTKISEVVSKDSEIDLLRNLNNELEVFKIMTDRYPNFDKEFLKALEFSDISIVSISYERSILELNLNSKKSNTPSEYVKYLDQSGLFSSTKYNGYSLDKGIYKFTIEAVVASGEDQ